MFWLFFIRKDFIAVWSTCKTYSTRHGAHWVHGVLRGSEFTSEDENSEKVKKTQPMGINIKGGIMADNNNKNVKREAISTKVEKFSSKGRKVFNKKRKIFNKMQNRKNFQQM